MGLPAEIVDRTFDAFVYDKTSRYRSELGDYPVYGRIAWQPDFGHLQFPDVARHLSSPAKYNGRSGRSCRDTPTALRNTRNATSPNEIIICCGINFFKDKGSPPPKHEMGGGAYIQPRCDGRRYEAVLTGLGLAIIRSMVESHGGRVWATRNCGRGTTFNFILPSRVAVPA